MKIGKQISSKRGWLPVVCLLSAMAAIFVLQTTGLAGSDEAKKNQKSAFALYQQKCLACHDSVADPEKPGRTRDDWHLVVNIMHGYGMDLTADEGGMIVDLLYALRRGIEQDPG